MVFVELYVPSTGFQCWLPDLPKGFTAHSQSGPVTCGGVYDTDKDYIEYSVNQDCVAFSDSGLWDKWSFYSESRFSHSSWDTCSGVYLISSMGGDSFTGVHTTSTKVNVVNDIVVESTWPVLEFDQR